MPRSVVQFSYLWRDIDRQQVLTRRNARSKTQELAGRLTGSAPLCYSLFVPMVENTERSSYFAFLQVSSPIAVLLFVPLLLSNNAKGVILGDLFLAVLFFFPGYLLLAALGRLPGGLRILLSPVFGIVVITTAYDIFARASVATYFPYCAIMVSAAGMVLLVLQARQAQTPPWWTLKGYETAMAGSAVVLTVAPLYWRSGRFSDGEFVFYGPVGHDPLFHVTLLQRLLLHVPPDNFIVSGLRATVYHYFDDLTLALILRAQSTLHLAATDLFDLYYRCYPVLVYFLLGALAYRVGRQLLGTARGGILGVLLLLGAGGLGWFLGVLQAAAHASQFSAMRASLFSDWSSWDGIGSILPLVHRPAHYHSLLICLAAITVLLQPERARRDWLLAGILFGLMAGFNFTLAATFGVAAVLVTLLLFLQRKQDEAHDLAWLAVFIFIGSLPVTAAMLFSGFHNPAPGFPFRGPNLEFPTAIWRGLVGRIMPAALISWASLIVCVIVAYGVKLFGLGAMARFDLGREQHRGIATVLAIVFALSFVIGMFFPYNALGGIGVVFMQPTLWILGLFSLRPIDAWLERNRTNWRGVALWSILGLTWVQALAAFNFSHKAAFDQDTAHAMQDVRLAAAPDDVVAYLPSGIVDKPIWGHPGESTNFAITAVTGLDGYFSSEPYSTSFAVPGLSGNPAEVRAHAKRLYEQRRDDIASFVKGDINGAAYGRLARDHVRWIVVSGDALRLISSSAIPWRKTREMAIYRLSP